MRTGIVVFTFAVHKCHILRVKQKLKYFGGIIVIVLRELEAKTQREWSNELKQSFKKRELLLTLQLVSSLFPPPLFLQSVYLDPMN